MEAECGDLRQRSWKCPIPPALRSSEVASVEADAESEWPHAFRLAANLI